MNYLIYGQGYLAKKFSAYFNAPMSSLRITDTESLQQELLQKKPDVVINCAGKTGKPNVDWCEDHKPETIHGNITVPLLLVQACIHQNIPFVHLSSGCIYEGDNNGKGFSEHDAPNFFGSFYSRTKIIAEQALKELPVLILRLRMPLDSKPDERNIITKITAYSRIISIPNSITAIEDLLFAAKKLIEKKATGIYNVVNPGAITHQEILETYKHIINPNHTYSIIPLDQLHAVTKAQRSNCVLNTEKLQKEGIMLRPVHDAVKTSLLTYKEHLTRQP